MNVAICRSCGVRFSIWRCTLKHCDECRALPPVYRYICPDGRSYVGSTHDLKSRKLDGLSRNNRRIKVAIERYPAEMWMFELLEQLPSKRPFHEVLEAEQRHIDRLGTGTQKKDRVMSWRDHIKAAPCEAATPYDT